MMAPRDAWKSLTINNKTITIYYDKEVQYGKRYSIEE